jgi:hypothetical protein
MPYCPNCRTEISANAPSCPSCDALFSGRGWRPLDAPAALVKPNPTPVAKIIVKLGLASVAIPAIAFVLGMLVSLIVPGCHCDEGAGCRGCGANDLVAFCLLGGFVGSLGALIFLLPASFILAAVVGAFEGRR